jgi:hypothetical protein
MAQMSWANVPFAIFMRLMRVATGPPPKDGGGDGDQQKRWRMGNGITVMLYSKPANIVTTPYISTNVRSNEQAAYAALLLYRPHSSIADLMTVNGNLHTSACACLAAIQPADLSQEGWDQISRVERRAADEAELRRQVRDSTGHEPDWGEAEGTGDENPFFVDEEIDIPDDIGAEDLTAATAATAPESGVYYYTSDNFETLRSFATLESQRRLEEEDTKMRRYDSVVTAQLNGGSTDATNTIQQALQQEMADLLEPLSAEQKAPFYCVASRTRTHNPVAEQLLAIVAGEAGTGKSKLLSAIIHFVRMNHGSKSVAVTAPTNSAAGLIHGHTINHVFRLNQYGTPHTTFDSTTPAGRLAIDKERGRLDAIKVLLIDEKSMLGLKMFNTLLEYYAMVFKGTDREHLAFGGRVHVVLAGALFQMMIKT